MPHTLHVCAPVTFLLFLPLSFAGEAVAIGLSRERLSAALCRSVSTHARTTMLTLATRVMLATAMSVVAAGLSWP